MYSTSKIDFFKKITANMLEDTEAFIAEVLQYFLPPSNHQIAFSLSTTQIPI